MRRRPPSSTRTDTLFPYPTLCRVEVDPTGRTPSASPACDTIEPAQHEEAHVTAYPSWTPAPRPGIVPLHPFGFGTTLGRSLTALRQHPCFLLGFASGVQPVAFLLLIPVTGVFGRAPDRERGGQAVLISGVR